MDGVGRYGGGSGGNLSQDCKTDCRNNREEGQRRRMLMGLGGCGIVGNTDLANKGVCEDAAGKNCGLCHREADT